MIKNQYSRKTIALFFIFTFLSSLLPSNVIYSQSAGPNAPEAGAFEPVDATDMVNLSTGDFTYVLPLLNVPSPEGGYPLALNYHAGIAMDQDASWVGLGWNLNAGAINRSINGAPDDYNSALITQHFWDSEQKVTEYHASIGYFFAGASIGLGFSWGSHRSLGGTVSIGVGIGDFGVHASGGSDGGNIGVGYNHPSGLTLGMSVNSKGKFSGSIGFDKNGSGFSVSTSGSYSVAVGTGSKKNGSITSTEITFSSQGVGLSVTKSSYKNTGTAKSPQYSRTQNKGVGLSVMSFSNTLKQGDYTHSQSGYMIPLFVPIGPGILSFSFGKQTYKFSANKVENNFVYGPLYYSNDIVDKQEYTLSCTYGVPRAGEFLEEIFIYNLGLDEANKILKEQEQMGGRVNCKCYIVSANINKKYMDILELPIRSGDFLDQENLLLANPNFPNYDKFNVQAQGLSGAITSRLFENSVLFGLTGKEDTQGNKVDYIINGGGRIDNVFKFKKQAYFYFENEISTYLETPIATLDNTILAGRSRGTINSNNILSSFKGTSYNKNTPLSSRISNDTRRKTANYIQHYTNKEILQENQRLRREGFLSTKTYLNRKELPERGIGAFKITAIDGKTYHYSLPVYNHEIVQRTYGISKKYESNISRAENKAYFEKLQLEPYATHWLLTAVTGADYVDSNNNGIVDKEDLGYWVGFDYGRYTQGFVWGHPYGKAFIENPLDKEIKTWARGRKELYYLNTVYTRSHTAYFIKSKREDGKSLYFNYSSATSGHPDSYTSRFSIPSQYPLRLDKIILAKSGSTVSTSSRGQYSKKAKVNYPKSDVKDRSFEYNAMNNVLDKNDNYRDLRGKIIKSIDFIYNYDLVKRAPNSDAYGRLTLESVKFKGKNEASVIPPYKFSYGTNKYFDTENKDDFGYYKGANQAWSLREITTPTGGKIKVDYEEHKVKSAFNFLAQTHGSYVDSRTLELINEKSYDFTEDVLIDVYKKEVGSVHAGCYSSDFIKERTINGRVFKISGNEVTIKTDEEIYRNDRCTKYSYKVRHKVNNTIFNQGGIRVKRVSTVDENNRHYSMDYSYGKDGDGVGYVTYLPYAPELATELPYSSELPPPKPMYEYVTTSTSVSKNGSDSNRDAYGVKTKYKFNVLKEKTKGKAKFGDFYELEAKQTHGTANSNTQLHSFTIKDNLGAIGQLLEVKTYNEEDQLLSSIKNNYYNPGETPNKLGVVQESYQTYKKITKKDKSEKKLGVTSTRITYPNLLKSSTELKGGHSYTSEFSDLDPITGQAREVLSYSSTGLNLKTKSIQAFRKYSKMGSKVDNVNNKNMLSQVAAEYSYISKDNQWKPIGVGITTWSDNWIYYYNGKDRFTSRGTWRKYQTYVWKGDIDNNGIYIDFNEKTDDDFKWDIESKQTNSDWQKVSEVSMYDHYSRPLEIKDINDNHMSSKTGDNFSKVIASSNSSYHEMFYSGVENLGDLSAVLPMQAGIVLTDVKAGAEAAERRWRKDKAHTGEFSLLVGNRVDYFQANLKAKEHRSGRYKLSVWVDKGNRDKARVSVNGTLKSFNGEKVYAGDWVLLTHYEDLQKSKNYKIGIRSSWGILYADDFRLHPVSSSMTSYVYNEWDEVSYIMGPNGLSTHYKYDAAGRLEKTYVEVLDNTTKDGVGGFKLVKENKYYYKGLK